MNFKNLGQEERDRVLKEQLPTGIVYILNRYRLVSTPDLKWVSKKENSHEHIIFTQKFLLKTDELGALFRINYLCFAKVKYFRENFRKYEPVKYDPYLGFMVCELWDSDFLRHKKTRKIVDYRFLQRITDVELFKQFCNRLENE